MAASPQQIFLSYSREDVAFARELRDWLLEQGHQPWMDLFDIPAGARWPTEIDRALKASAVVIGLLSPSAVQSDNVLNEWDWAIANGRRLILLLVEPCEIPFHYVSRNYIDFTGGRGDGFASLDAALRQDARSRNGAMPAVEEALTASDAPAAPSHAFSAPRSGSRLGRAMSRQRVAPALVGREQERARLGAALERAGEGQGSLALIGGEAGIGKTTLTAWLQVQAEERGALVLSGGCYDLATTPPYGPWTEILRVYQPVDGLPPVPTQIRDDAGLASIPSQAALFDIVGEFFAEVSDHRPLLLVLEDLHWADVATLEFLRFFARFLGGLPILLVATYRDDELTRRHPLFELLPVLVREAGAERINLHRLDQGDVRDLVAGRYALDDADTNRLVAHLMRMAEGNPFFSGELLSSLEEEGLLSRDDGGWRLGDLEAIAVPPLLRQVVERRLARLEEDDRRLLEVAAVIGQEASLDLWSRVSEASEDALAEAMRRALDAHLLEESPDGESLNFRHALIREALYLGIVPIERRRRHRAVAEALIAGPRPDPDAVVTHLEQAHDPRLIDWLVRAGERAKTRLAWEVAIERYERALELVELQPEPDPVLHCEVLLALGDAQDRAGVGRGQAPGAGNDPEARATYWHAAEVARAAGLAEHLARAALGFAGMSFGGNHGGEPGFRLMGEALKQLPPGDSALRARLMVRRSLAALLQMTVEGTSPPGMNQASAKQLEEEAVAMARRLDDPATLAYVLSGRMTILTGSLEDLDREIEIVDEALQIARFIDDLERVAWALVWKVELLTQRGKVARAMATLEELDQIADLLQLRLYRWFALINRTSFALSTGDLTAAELLIQESEIVWPHSAVTSWQVFSLRREQARLDEDLGEVWREWLDHHLTVHTVHPYRVIWLLETGQLEQARDLFSMVALDAVADWPRTSTWLRNVTLLSEASAALDQESANWRLYELLLPFCDFNISHGSYSDEIGGSVAHYLGLLAGALEDWEVAERHFSLALEKNRQWGYRLHIAHTLYAWAEMLSRRDQSGDRERALEMLDEALALAGEIGMVVLEGKARALIDTLMR